MNRMKEVYKVLMYLYGAICVGLSFVPTFKLSYLVVGIIFLIWGLMFRMFLKQIAAEDRNRQNARRGIAK